MTVAIRKRGGVRNPSAPQLNREKPLRRSLPFANFQDALGVYSLRKLNPSYTGPLVSVRRSGDGAEQAIYANSSGNLDEKALMDFVGRNVLGDTVNWSLGWPVDYCSRTAAPGITSPDGANTAYKLIPSAYNTQHGIFQTTAAGSITQGSIFTLSVYVKAAEYTYAFIWVDDGSGHGATVEVNLTNGASRFTRIDVGSYSDTSSTCTNVGNGWYRVVITTTPTVYSRIGLRVYVGNAAYVTGGFGTPVFLADGTSGIYIWGPQIEGGSTVTDYFPISYATSGVINATITRIYDQSLKLSNRLDNGTFDGGTSTWNYWAGDAALALASETSTKRTGAASLKVSVTTPQTTVAGGVYAAAVAALPGETINASIYARSNVANKVFRIVLEFRNSSSVVISALAGPDVSLTNIDTWYQFTNSQVAPAGTAWVTIALYASSSSTIWNTGDIMYVDDASLTRSGVYKDAVQGSTTRQPFITYNGLPTKANGRVAAYGDGSRSLFVGTATDWQRTTTSSEYWMIVRSTSTVTDYKPIVGAGNAGVLLTYLEVGSHTAPRIYSRSTVYVDNGQRASPDMRNVTLSLGTCATELVGVKDIVNGAVDQVAANAITGPFPMSYPITIFHRDYPSTSGGFIGYITDLLFFQDMNLTDTRRAALSAEQMKYYGIQAV